MSHSGHGVQICQWGYSHGRCRCPETEYVHVTCDDPGHDPKNSYQGKHRKQER